jgi:hypothetical protein
MHRAQARFVQLRVGAFTEGEHTPHAPPLRRSKQSCIVHVYQVHPGIIHAMDRRRVLPAFCCAAAVSTLPLLGVGYPQEVQSSRRMRHRRRGLREQSATPTARAHPRYHHLALLDPTKFEEPLGSDYQWALSNIPLLELDPDVVGGASITRAYYYRWRVFKRHIRTRAPIRTDDLDTDAICCSGTSSSVCELVSAASGWCAGARSQTACHASRTEARPCVWSETARRCARGFPHGSSRSPACPHPSSSARRGSPSRQQQSAQYVITEFEPSVPWSGKENTIGCSAGHHIVEGRWLRNGSYIDSYASFWFEGAGGGEPRAYSFWAASSLVERYAVTGDAELLRRLYPSLGANYRAWVDGHTSEEHGCLWQYADRDGQEHSIGGDGCRPLLNALMYAEARALATIARLADDTSGVAAFSSEAHKWQHALLSLWSPSLGFFVTRAARRPPTVAPRAWTEMQRADARASNGGRCPPAWLEGQLVGSRELSGLSSPWYFKALPTSKNASTTYAGAWQRLAAVGGFGAKWGPRTAEAHDPCYNYSAAHECLWNGPSWPFETSKLITGALNMLHEYPAACGEAAGVDTMAVWRMMRQYARVHTHARAINASGWRLDGSVSSAWIGESVHPDDGYWLPRALMYAAGRSDKERGRHYLHSTFSDPLFALFGVRPAIDGTLTVRSLVPAARLGMAYFAIDGMRIHGHDVCVAFDADGKRYGLGTPGMHVLVDGRLAASAPLGEPIIVNLKSSRTQS